jgi:hypothetical protein
MGIKRKYTMLYSEVDPVRDHPRFQRLLEKYSK